MPWANTGFAAPNNFTDGAGIYNYSAGTVTTTLIGKYVKIADICGAVSFSSATGSWTWAASNGNHDCTIAGGGGAGNTRRGALALLRAQQAEGAGPRLAAHQHLAAGPAHLQRQHQPAPATPSGTARTVNFYRSGGGCRNTGEIGAVFDHEWGHGMDNYDANGTLSNSSEGYADIAAIYRLQTSCVGHGFFQTANKGCGQTADGTGYNANEAQIGRRPGATRDCSGVRDSDWAKHSPANTPDTPQNFVCSRCSSGTRPVRPAGALRRRARAPGRLGLRRARPARRRPSTTTPTRPSSSATRSSTRAAATSARGTPATAPPAPPTAAAPPTATCSGWRRTTTTAT